jgi:hypothetical protein
MRFSFLRKTDISEKELNVFITEYLINNPIAAELRGKTQRGI